MVVVSEISAGELVASSTAVRTIGDISTRSHLSTATSRHVLEHDVFGAR